MTGVFSGGFGGNGWRGFEGWGSDDESVELSFVVTLPPGECSRV